MGSMLTKNSPGLIVWSRRKVEKKRYHETHRRPPRGTSPATAQATVHTHHVEVHMHQITQEKNVAPMMVPSDAMEPQRSQETSLDGVETQSLVRTSGSAKVAELAVDPTGEVTVQTEVPPTGLDLCCEGKETAESCKMRVVGQAFGVSSERSNDACASESPLPSSTVSEEDNPLEVPSIVSPIVLESASWKTMKDLHSPLNGPSGGEPFANDQKASREMDLEVGPEETVGATEVSTVVQSQSSEAFSGATLVMAETHSRSAPAEASRQLKRKSK